jgi:RNA polymerase sigma factor (TIGR02999 family)
MSTPPSTEVTELLLAWNRGDEQALETLTPLVYRELHRLAKRYMAGERQGRTLQASALVNEAYLKLVDLRQMHWKNRAHFFAMSARLMRRILVDYARRRHYLKRGGRGQQVTFHEELLIGRGQTDEVIVIDHALKALETVDQRKARVVELRFFGGLSNEEIAESLNISTDTVMRDWKMAKVLLQREITKANAR